MKKLTLKGLARELCRREGKRQQVNIAQMSEIVKAVFDVAHVDYAEFRVLLYREVEKRAAAECRLCEMSEKPKKRGKRG